MPVVLPNENKRTRLDFLDGLRALAALFVLLHHTRQSTFGDHVIEAKGLLSLVSFPFTFGHLGVSLFIVLSGYCLMLPVLSRGSFDGKRFLLRRAQRILPPYYAAVILTLGMTLLTNRFSAGAQETVSWQGILARLFLCHDVSEAIMLQWNRALWSIAVEWRIYFIFPLIVAGVGRYGAGKTVLIVSLCSLVLLFALDALAPHAPGLTLDLMAYAGVRPQFLGLFGLGCLAAVWSLSGNKPSKPRLLVFSLLGIGLALALEFLWKIKERELPHFVSDYLFGAGVACLLMYLAITPRGHLRTLLEWRPLVALGGMSYSFYLLHNPVERFLSRVLFLRFSSLSPISTFVLLSLLAFLATLALAGVFFILVEQPAQRWAAKTRT